MIICSEQDTRSLAPPVYHNIMIPSTEGTKYWLKTGNEQQNAEFYHDTHTKKSVNWHSSLVQFSVNYNGGDYSSNG